MMQQPINQAAKLAQFAKDFKRFNRANFFEPYPKQQAFFTMGVNKRERCFLAGNRVGKTEGGAYEMSCHLTGRYPSWWRGVRFDHPIVAWAAGVVNSDTRDIIQSKLCGQYGVIAAQGTGMIPRDCLQECTSGRSIADLYDTVHVQHQTNGVIDGTSILALKSFERGRTSFQGGEIDVGWCDEEPSAEIYSEFLTRLGPKGIMIATLTPLLGMTQFIERFLTNPGPDQGVIHMALEEAQHFTPEQIAQRIAAMPAHEREARSKGVPLLGSGKVFPFVDDQITHDLNADHLPEYWSWLCGCDFQHASGSVTAHPFAWVSAAINKDSNQVYLFHEEKISGRYPNDHAYAIKEHSCWGAPLAFPHDGARHDHSGMTLAATYKKLGLNLLASHSTWKEGGYSKEAGVEMMLSMFQLGKLKVHRTMFSLLEEIRFYHRREDGSLVETRDDLLSCVRQILMSMRFAKPLNRCEGAAVPRFAHLYLEGSQMYTDIETLEDNYLGPNVGVHRPRRGEYARGLDFNIFEV